MAYQNTKEEISYSQPDMDPPEKDRTDGWYKQMTRFCCTFYNRIYNIYSTDNHDENITPVERGMRYSLYYLGKQRNIDYNHVTKDISGNNLQAVWIKGKKVRQLISHLVGNVINQLENKEIVARTLSKDAVSRKTQMYEDLMFKYDTQSKKFFEQLTELGVSYNPEGDRSFESVEEIERFMENDYKETTEEIAVDIAKDIEEKNDAATMYVQAFLEYAAANYCGIYTYVENGVVKQKKIPFYNLVWDQDNNDPFCRNSRFKGFIERLTPQEIFSRWPEYFDNNKDAREEVTKMAGKSDTPFYQTMQANYNMPNLNWWSYDRDKQLTVCVTTMFWIQRRDSRYKNSKDEYGNKRINKVSKDTPKKPGDYFFDDMCRTVLVGNKYLVEKGYADNVVRKAGKKGDPEFPIGIFADNTTLGDGVPLIGLVAQNQDRQDFFRYKIMEMVGKDKGKCYWVNGNKLNESVSAQEILTDFASMGIHVSTGTSGEADDWTNGQKAIEVVDLTLDPNIMRYVELYREEERIMEEIMNIPKIALGQQQTYIGLGTQRGTIAQSTLGLSMIFKNFTKFNEINLQYAINLAKIIYTEDGNDEAAMVVGDRGVKWLKITKDMRFQDLLVFIKTKDIINEQEKQAIMANAQAWSQNPSFGIDPVDILKLMQATSKTEMINDLEYSMKVKKRDAAKAQQMQAEQQIAMQDKELQAEAEMLGAEEAGDNHRAEVQAQTQLATAVIKQDGKENPTAGLPIKK
jgi:hypothetical protein